MSLTALFDHYDKRGADAETLAAAIQANPDLVPASSRLIYRCTGRRCALMKVYRTPDGEALLIHPRYKLSEAVNAAESSADGREANTEDGNRHWKGWAGWLQESNQYPVGCDHTRTLLGSERIVADLDRRARTVYVSA